MKTSIRYQVLIFTLLLTAAMPVRSVTSRQTGRPFIRNYTVKEYRAQQQNWSIARDKQGIMYFGNGGGLLTFDGHNWEITKLAVMRAIGIDSTGRIYVGLENNAGYLEPEKTGNFQFHSFKPLLPEKYRDLTPVLCVFVKDNRVIFQTNEGLFVFRNGQFKIFPSESGFHRTFEIRDMLISREIGKGLWQLQGDSLHFIEGSEIFADERICCMLPYGKNEVLMITVMQGSFIYSPEGKIRFRKIDKFNEVDQIFTQNWPLCGITLPDGNIAVGTITAGIIVFSPEGRIIHTFNKQAGLQDNTVYNIFCDQDRNLWAALENGISRIEYSLPFVYFTEQEGLLGSIYFVKYFEDRLYIGTGQYLHIQKPDGSFEIIPGTDGQNFDLISAHNILLLAHNPGVYEVRGNRAYLLPGSSNIYASCFWILNNDPDHLLVGGAGIDVMEYGPAGWKVKNHIRDFIFPVYIILEDRSGNLWVYSNTSLYRVQLNNNLDSVIACTEIKAERGMPEENAYPFRLLSGEVVFSTGKGIYRYLPEKDIFERHPDFLMINWKVIPFNQVADSSIWFEEAVGSFNYQKGVLRPVNGKYQAHKIPFYKFNDENCNESSPNICVLPDKTVFFGTNKGLLKYFPQEKSYSQRVFQTLIRKVFARDSLLSGGNKTIETSAKPVIAELPYSLNDLTFHFSATFFEDAEKNLFSYRLTGLDTAWSAWSADHKKEYTNLREGKYTFEVKSMNQYLVQGSPDAFTFRISAPWYRKWWMYLTYVLLGGTAVYGLISLRTRNLRIHSLTLEKTVRERTNEIRKQKDNVEKLSKIGRDITSSLSIENIIKTVYANVNTLMDASVFTIGLYKPEKNCLEFPAAIEKGVQLEPFTISTSEENRLAAWCFLNRQEVIINDYLKDSGKYIKLKVQPIAGEIPESVLYLPLWSKEKVIGVISAQSFSKNAYNDYHVNMLRNLATYSAIALENADAYKHLATLLDELRTAQDRLVTQSKLAALGELTAGIAHEIQNPLNFVNNFSEINNELMDELKEELAKENPEDVNSLVDSIKVNLEKINYHGKRADSIVKGMLLHSRGTSGQKQPTDINSLCDEFFRLAYHGLRAKDKAFTAVMKTQFDENIGKVDVVSQDIGQVVLNLITNAFYAVTAKKKMNLAGYEPTVWVTTQKLKGKIEICVKDNGTGIPQKILDKIFQPFFTTKPAGEGTGLGLSLAYDIVTKEHHGELKVESSEGEGSTFIVQISC